jgi:pyoverdine/dityrosine biosynthesis protein Dit1
MRISRQLATATVVVALCLATTAVVARAQSPPGMKMYVFSSGALFLDILCRHIVPSHHVMTYSGRPGHT